MQCWHALIIKRDFATDQNIEHNSEAPDIDFGTGVNLGVEQLGSGEIQGTAECRQMVGRVVEIGETEVDDLDVPRM